jgi:hypothetical protein
MYLLMIADHGVIVVVLLCLGDALILALSEALKVRLRIYQEPVLWINQDMDGWPIVDLVKSMH